MRRRWNGFIVYSAAFPYWLHCKQFHFGPFYRAMQTSTSGKSVFNLSVIKYTTLKLGSRAYISNFFKAVWILSNNTYIKWLNTTYCCLVCGTEWDLCHWEGWLTKEVGRNLTRVGNTGRIKFVQLIDFKIDWYKNSMWDWRTECENFKVFFICFDLFNTDPSFA